MGDIHIGSGHFTLNIRNSNFAAKKWWLAFTLPALIYFLIFAVYPMIGNVILTFQKETPLGAYVFVGFKNYEELFYTPYLNKIIENSLIYTFVVPVIDLLLAIPLANFLKRLNKNFLLPLILLPSFIPLVTGATIWILMLNPFYGITYFFYRKNLFTTIWSIVIMDVWSSLPLATLIIYSGLKSIPKNIEEACNMDNIRGMKKFISIDIPFIRYQLLSAFILMLIYGAFTFDPIYASLGISTPFANIDLSYYSYQLFFGGQLGFSAVLMTIMTIVSTVIAIFFVKLTLSKNKRVSKFHIRIPNKELQKYLVILFTIVYLAFFLLPFIWLLLESFKTYPELFTIPPQIVPVKWTLSNYIYSIIHGAPYFITSVIVAFLGSLLALFIGIFAAYSSSKNRIWGTRFIGLVLFVYSIPLVIFMIPDYSILNFIHLINTWWGLILLYPVIVMPIIIWMLYNFYSTFPKHYDEAAQMDGFTTFGSFRKIVLPLSIDGILVAFLYAFVFAWGALIFPLAFTYSPFNMSFIYPFGAQTITIFIGGALGHEAAQYGILAAASILSTIPAFIIAFFVRSRIDQVWRGSGLK
jgi:multiple sugar transport system permease protein